MDALSVLLVFIAKLFYRLLTLENNPYLSVLRSQWNNIWLYLLFSLGWWWELVVKCHFGEGENGGQLPLPLETRLFTDSKKFKRLRIFFTQVLQIQVHLLNDSSLIRSSCPECRLRMFLRKTGGKSGCIRWYHIFLWK